MVHLNALVNDLHELSMSDQGALIYEKDNIDLVATFEVSNDMNKHLLKKHDITLSLNINTFSPGNTVMISGDENRLLQLFDNLFQNTCRYTNKGGKLNINIREKVKHVVIDWFDSEPGD